MCMLNGLGLDIVEMQYMKSVLFPAELCHPTAWYLYYFSR